MFITSVEHFLGVLLATLERAKKNLKEDDDLHNMVLMYGPNGCIQMCVQTIPRPLVGPIISAMVEARRSEVEYVLYIVRGSVTLTEKAGVRHADLTTDLTAGGAQCILIEGSHPDFGSRTAHVAFVRRGPKDFDFEDPLTGTLVTSPVFKDLWPKRKLNS